MPTLIELTAYIVSAHISNKQMSSEKMHQELQQVHAALSALEPSTAIPPDSIGSSVVPKLTIKQAFKKDEVICMICGKGFTTLKRHLAVAHAMKPGQYRKQFGILSTQSLAAKSYVESRRQMAIDNGLAELMSKAKVARTAVKAGVPMVRVKAPVPAVKVKAPVPAKVQKITVSTKIKKPIS